MRNNYKRTADVEALLLYRGAMSRAQLVRALCLPASASLRGPFMALQKRYGARFVPIKEGTVTRWKILAKAPKAATAAARARFQLPEDLWRGWVNPATGIVPERLGV